MDSANDSSWTKQASVFYKWVTELFPQSFCSKTLFFIQIPCAEYNISKLFIKYLYVCFFPHKLFINTALYLTTVCISVLKESQREAGLLGLHFSLKECWSCKQTIRASSVGKVFETLVQLSAASKHRGIVGFPARSRLVMNWYVFLEMSLSDPGADVFAH